MLIIKLIAIIFLMFYATAEKNREHKKNFHKLISVGCVVALYIIMFVIPLEVSKEDMRAPFNMFLFFYIIDFDIGLISKIKNICSNRKKDGK